MKQINYSNDLENFDNEMGSEGEIVIGFNIINHPKYKFKRVTHIPLDLNRGFELVPQIIGLNF